ncbi:MAG: TIM barrel protein [Puniceicoccales bacterium]|jgi:hydroxypyruvate isomerase|nr:TIM barrel protein [Puniceicoccales bacterium]
MNRRDVLKTIAAASSLAVFTPDTSAARNKNAASSSGSFKHSVCAWCYRMPLEKLILGAKKIGLDSVELLNLDQIPLVQKHGLTCAVANGPSSIPNGFNRSENHKRYVPAFIKAIEQCAALNVPNIICFSGNRRGQSDAEGLEICAQGLKQIMSAAEKNKVTVVMELLNSKINHKDYQCDHTEWGVELVKRVGSERFKLLYDIYHMQVMEGDVIRNIRRYKDYIGHYHTAGNPGRNEFEPQDVQELNYTAISKTIHDIGFRGYLGQEFTPRRSPLASLAAAVKICTVS